jgi:hypothetical protein
MGENMSLIQGRKGKTDKKVPCPRCLEFLTDEEFAEMLFERFANEDRLKGTVQGGKPYRRGSELTIAAILYYLEEIGIKEEQIHKGYEMWFNKQNHRKAMGI